MRRWCAWRRIYPRYPLIDGIGNFGSRDGDGRRRCVTETRLTPIAELLLSEINQGMGGFQPNYDGAFDEPLHPPARRLWCCSTARRASQGMATEIPSHNLNEGRGGDCAVEEADAGNRRPDAIYSRLILPGGQIIRRRTNCAGFTKPAKERRCVPL